jgi:hypothetical protein
MASAAAAEPAKETKRVVKLSMFFHKKAGMSDEEFHGYWAEVHGPLLSSLRYFKEKIIKYNQVCLNAGLASFCSPQIVENSL